MPGRLLLIRHAKAAHGPVDLDRPLTERGRRQAAAVGAWLQRTGLVPDRVLISPARRAQQTWAGAAAALASAPEPTTDARVYDNTVESVMAAVGETSQDVGVLLVVGHNPSMGELVDVLDDGRGDPAVRAALDNGFPTGSAAVLVCHTSFSAVAAGSATLTDVLATQA